MEKLQRHTENYCEPFTQLLLLKQTQDFFSFEVVVQICKMGLSTDKIQ